MVFSDFHLRHKPIITIGALLGTITWFIVFLVLGISWTTLLDASLNLGMVITILIVAWTSFVKYAWRWKWVRRRRWLVRTPDLNGRWEGTYRSSYDQIERPYVLEIRQSLLNLQCETWGDKSEAEVYGAHILSDRDEEVFKLSYLYRAKRKPSSSIAGDQHDGWTMLRLIEGPPKKLSGGYVNDRDPDPRKGEIEATFVSKKTKGQP